MFFLFFCHLFLEVHRIYGETFAGEAVSGGYNRSRKSEQILPSVRAEQPVSIAFQVGAEFEHLVIPVLLYMMRR